MENKNPLRENDTQRKSSLFSLDEENAASIIAILTIVASFVPWISYAAFLLPLAAVLTERKSGLVRVTGLQCFFASLLISAASLVTLVITPYAESAINAAEMGRTFGFGTLGIIMSVLRITCLAVIVLTAYNARKGKIFDIPYVTGLIKNLIKYSKN